MKKIYLALVLVIILFGSLVTKLRPSSEKISKPIEKSIYLALGDSVAAGQGLDTASDSSACLRTEESYPNLVAKKLSFKLKNIACSSATLQSGISGSQTVNGLVLPAQIYQITSDPRLKLISITIGANDIEWTKFLAKCFTGNCGSDADSAFITSKLKDLTVNLDKTLTEIVAKNLPNTKIILTGYYHLFPSSSTNCDGSLGVTEKSMNWFNVQTDLFNSVIAEISAKYNFVKFVKTDFAGHELCTKESYIQGIQDKAPFHPTDKGQETIAEAILAK